MTSERSKCSYGVFIGPLHQSKDNARKTAEHLFRLMLAMGVRNADIGKVIIDPEEGFALVLLRSREVEDFMVKAGRHVRDILNVFDLRLLTANPKHLKVIRRRAPFYWLQMEMSSPKTKASTATSKVPVMSPGSAAKGSLYNDTDASGEFPGPSGPDIEGQPDQKQTALNIASWTDSSSSIGQQDFEQAQDEQPLPMLLHASTSISASHAWDEGHEEGSVVKVDVKTSTPQVSPCFCPETIFYHKKQHVGSENRHVEFKRGGNLQDLRSFRGVVGKYMCAFLNTEGGTIYFGVTDDGKVFGIEANQKAEDMIRLTIDNAVSMMKPFVSTAAYSVNFAKVMNEDGSIVEDLKVLEVCVKPRVPPREKFTFNDATYVRRDGSLRTL